MAVQDCLNQKVADQKVSREAADKVLRELRDLQTSERLGEAGAEAATDATTAARLQKQLEENRVRQAAKWRRLNAINKQLDALARADAALNRLGTGSNAAGQAARQFFEFNPSQRTTGPNISREYQGIRSQAHALMSDATESFRPNLRGNPRGGRKATEVLERDIVREMFGETTNNTNAKAMADGMRESLNFLRTQFNNEGGSIRFRDDFGMPQQHDPTLVGQVSKQEWKDAVAPKLDASKMLTRDGVQPQQRELSSAEIDELLDGMYDTITTRGLNDMDPTNPQFAEQLTGRQQQQRSLQFKSADDWIEYQRQFGPGGPKGTSGKVVLGMQAHVDNMARDIAVMRVLGPSPSATMDAVARQIRKTTAQANVGKANAGGVDTRSIMDDLFIETTGKSNIPINENLAGTGIAARNTLNAAILGQAFLSALTDVGFASTAARFNGMPQIKVAKQFVDQLASTGGGGAQRRQAMRLGLGAQGAIERAHASSRISGEALGTQGAAGLSRKFSDAVMRVSLLQPWTEAGRWSFGTEMLATLTERGGKSFDELDGPIQRMFTRNGIDGAMWDRIRSGPRFTDPETGADFIRPMDLARTAGATAEAKATREAGQALQRMISTETEFAIPSSLATGRAGLRFGTRPGTFSGEVVRSATMLKNFPVTVMMLQYGRLAGIDGGANRAKYMAWLAVTTGAMGVLAEQLSTIADGKNPRPMDTSEGGRQLAMDGLWRAGSFGLMGDVLLSDFDKFGSSLGESLAGPLISNVGEGVGIGRDAVGNVLTGDDNPVARDARSFAGGLIPGQNLWFTKLATERLIADSIQKAIDPDYADSFRRTEQIAEDQGTSFFFRPGGGLDDAEAPELGNIFGEQ